MINSAVQSYVEVPAPIYPQVRGLPVAQSADRVEQSARHSPVLVGLEGEQNGTSGSPSAIVTPSRRTLDVKQRNASRDVVEDWPQAQCDLGPASTLDIDFGDRGEGWRGTEVI